MPGRFPSFSRLAASMRGTVLTSRKKARPGARCRRDPITAPRHLFSLFLCAAPLAATASPLCLYVSSYHAGYHWNDGIEAGLIKGLGDACELRRFYLDTLRNKAPEFAAAQGAAAKRLIDETRPDIVIACDDPASKHLVMPFLKGAATPVVFCGINWTLEPYGYPYPNATGMIEVAPIRPLLQAAREMVPEAREVAFLTADVPTQHKEVERLNKLAETEGLKLAAEWVADFETWKTAFERVQGTELVILGNPAGIAGWDDAVAGPWIRDHTRRLTLSFGVAMSRHVVFAMINVPEEQGEWSGAMAKAILAGARPAELPITANRRWQMFANPGLAQRVGVRLPEHILEQAILVEGKTP
jgi:hypothetical protein